MAAGQAEPRAPAKPLPPAGSGPGARLFTAPDAGFVINNLVNVYLNYFLRRAFPARRTDTVTGAGMDALHAALERHPGVAAVFGARPGTLRPERA